MFGKLFADPTLKEPRLLHAGVRPGRQAAQGQRGAHLLLRQAQFSITAVAPETIRRTIAEAEALSGSLADDEPVYSLPPSAGAIPEGIQRFSDRECAVSKC